MINKDFLIPFLSTLGASLAIIVGQQIFSFKARQRKKLYCMSYISDVAYRLLSSTLIVKRHTTLPHIVATKRIIAGNTVLLDTMFKTDEFDILNGATMKFDHLPEEYKLLVGFDSMPILQAFNFLIALSIDESSKLNLNSFVKENLKSELLFHEQSQERQDDILNTYWDLLDNENRHIDRINNFIIDVITPLIENYKNRFGFICFSKKSINKNLDDIHVLQKENMDILSKKEDLQNRIHNGIQKVL